MTLDELTYKVSSCAMKVHNVLGNGFQEVIYQRCLAIELEKAGLSFNREIDQTIFYEGANVGSRRAVSSSFSSWFNTKLICHGIIACQQIISLIVQDKVSRRTRRKMAVQDPR